MHFESVCGYLCDMKKSTIWIIASVMGVFFLTLLFLQAKYFEEVINMRKEQFDESVTRSLYQTARNLELNETKRGLEVQLGNRTTSKAQADDTTKVNEASQAFDHRLHANIPANVPKGLFLDNLNTNADDESLRDSVRQRYIYQRALLNEVVYSILYKASNQPLAERVDFRSLDSDLRAELRSNGINLNYHFYVTTRGLSLPRLHNRGRPIYLSTGTLPQRPFRTERIALHSLP